MLKLNIKYGSDFALIKESIFIVYLNFTEVSCNEPISTLIKGLKILSNEKLKNIYKKSYEHAE
jgi:hypothetical protein